MFEDAKNMLRNEKSTKYIAIYLKNTIKVEFS
jgi:hypothetical protein